MAHSFIILVGGALFTVGIIVWAGKPLNSEVKCSSDRLSAERNGLRGTATFLVPSSQSIN